MLLVTGGDASAARRYAPLVMWATPLFAVLSLAIFARAPPERRAHRASRLGAILSVVALALWALVLYSTQRAPA